MLELEGSLRLDMGDDDTIEVVAEGSQLTVDVSFKPKRVRSFINLRGSRELAGRLSEVLYQRGLTLTVTREGKPLLKIGRGARDSVAGRLAGVAHIQLFPKFEKRFRNHNDPKPPNKTKEKKT